LDPFSPLGESEQTQLSGYGIELNAINTLGDLTLALRRAHVLVIRLGDSADLLREVQTLIGQLGFNAPVICRVEPDGAVHVAAEDLIFPNGMVLTPDGRTLIVAETLALRLTAFDVANDGTLSNRRVWADLSEQFGAPDGICLDAEGAVWIAAATTPRAMRIAEGGEVLEVIETSKNCYALMLGGPEGRHLFMMTAPSSESHAVADVTTASIEVVEVAVPHAGLP
jgi:sugar lactone lactonase YvrE